MKFNLRFARDTDLEKLRKAAKKIGVDMMEIPEFKAEILAPFKMQGVADIADNALLVRFKFTAKPGNPASHPARGRQAHVRHLPRSSASSSPRKARPGVQRLRPVDPAPGAAAPTRPESPVAVAAS